MPAFRDSGREHGYHRGGVVAGPLRPDDVNIYRDGLPAVTMIGLSVAQTPWTATTEVPPIVRTASPSGVDDARTWFRRAIAGTFGAWLRTARAPSQIGS